MPWRRRFARATARAEAFERVREAVGEADRGAAPSRSRSPPIASRDPAGAVRVVERELAEHAGAQHRDVLPALARRGRDRVEVEERADVDALEALRGGDEQPRPVRRREDERLGAAARPATSRGELPKSKPSMCSRRRSPASFAGPSGLGERARVVDLRAAEDALVAGRERLVIVEVARRTSTTIADRRRRLLAGREGDVDAHAVRLVRMSTAEPPRTATGIRTARRDSRARSAAGRSAPTA